jgi:hypothetical protein
MVYASGQWGYHPVHYLATQSNITEMPFLAESGINLTLQTDGLSGCLTVLDIAAQCLKVEVCAHLVRQDVLVPDDAPHMLTNTLDARSAMDGIRVFIVHLLLSKGEFDPDVVSPGGDSFLFPVPLGGVLRSSTRKGHIGRIHQ